VIGVLENAECFCLNDDMWSSIDPWLTGKKRTANKWS